MPSASDGRWITTDFLQDSSVAGLDARHISRPELRSKEDTEFAAAALTQQRSSRESPVRLRTWLHPALEPGQRLELADMPESVPVQECRIRQIVSTIAPDRDATTEIWASGQVEGASAFGDLLGALGGLL